MVRKRYTNEEQKLLDAIRCEMEKEGINEAEFSTKAGITPSTVNRTLKGKRGLTVSFLQGTAKALPQLQFPISEFIVKGGANGIQEEAKGNGARPVPLPGGKRL